MFISQKSIVAHSQNTFAWKSVAVRLQPCTMPYQPVNCPWLHEPLAMEVAQRHIHSHGEVLGG